MDIKMHQCSERSAATLGSSLNVGCFARRGLQLTSWVMGLFSSPPYNMSACMFVCLCCETLESGGGTIPGGVLELWRYDTEGQWAWWDGLGLVGLEVCSDLNDPTIA